jgi:hypothetical protein
MRSRLARAAFVLLLATSCRARGPRQGYVALEQSLGALRSQFNADLSKVRVLMLVAPT